MKKVRILALLLAMMMLASFAVAESTDDVVVRVGDVTIGQAQAQDFFDYYYDQYVQLYAEYGMTLTDTDISDLRTAVVDALAQNAMMDAKIAELGLGEITDADKATLREEIEAGFEADLASYAAYTGLSIEEARETVAAEGYTADVLYEQNLLNLPYIRLEEYAVKDVAVTDEDVKAEFDSYVEEDKATFENDVATYEMYMNYYGNTEMYYTPEGFRYVKQILLAIPDDIAAQMSDIKADMDAAQTAITDDSNELNAIENPVEGAEAPTRTAAEVQADIDSKTAEYDALNTRYEEAREQIQPALQPTIDEIQQKLAGGASFDDLVAEYNADPGMQSNVDGYRVHAESIIYDTTFRDAAMALANVGDVSEPVLTQFGIHILQYAGDVPSGAVELTDEVAAALKESLLSFKQEEAYTEAFDAWMNEFEVETYPEKITLPASPEADIEAAQDDLPADTAADDQEEAPAANEDGSVG